MIGRWGYGRLVYGERWDGRHRCDNGEMGRWIDEVMEGGGYWEGGVMDRDEMMTSLGC